MRQKRGLFHGALSFGQRQSLLGLEVPGGSRGFTWESKGGVTLGFTVQAGMLLRVAGAAISRRHTLGGSGDPRLWPRPLGVRFFRKGQSPRNAILGCAVNLPAPRTEPLELSSLGQLWAGGMCPTRSQPCALPPKAWLPPGRLPGPCLEASAPNTHSSDSHTASALRPGDLDGLLQTHEASCLWPKMSKLWDHHRWPLQPPASACKQILIIVPGRVAFSNAFISNFSLICKLG